jgi:quinoprotein relay system zinc metallohydrolase 2
MGRLIARLAVGLLVLAGLAAAAEPMALTEVAAGAFVRHGIDQDATAENGDAIANIGFVIGRDAVAVIDPGGSRTDGERLRAAILARTDRPIRYVIMTHFHPDHVFGAIAFRPDNPVFVGHVRMPGAMAARGTHDRHRLEDLLGHDEAGDFVAPGQLVEGRTEIDLGARVLVLDAHGPAHTGTDLTVFDRSAGLLWAGDLLFVGRVPAIDGSVTGWLRELEVLQALPARLAVPGHGPVSVAWPAAAADERRYLETLVRETRAVIAAGGDIERAIATVGQGERGKWTLFDDYNGRNVTEAFKQLEWE